MEMMRLAIVAALACVAIACDSQPQHVDASSVHITRNPGLVVVPKLDRTITDAAIATQLANDIQNLPAFPNGAMNCPVDFGTTYSLAFSSGWSAVASVQGCQTVKLSDGRTLWAWNATKLFTDLGSALGLAQDELIPIPCPAALAGTRCYPQPSQ